MTEYFDLKQLRKEAKKLDNFKNINGILVSQNSNSKTFPIILQNFLKKYACGT